MNSVLSKITLFLGLIALKLGESSVSTFERNFHGGFDLNDNLIPKLQPSKPTWNSHNSGFEKRFKDYPADLQTYPSKNRKIYDEFLSKGHSLIGKFKQPSSKSLATQRIPERDTGKEILERDPRSEAAVTKVRENTLELISDATLESNTEIPHVETSEERFSLHPVNFQRSESEEAFVERNERSEPGKKLLLTLQLPSPENPRVPETFVCQPVPQVGSVDLMAPVPACANIPSVSQTFIEPDYYAPETPAETKFRSTLKNNFRHLDHEPVKAANNKVLDDVVSRLKSAVLTFEDQLKDNCQGQVTDPNCNKENEEKITRKFLSFVQQFLSLYDHEDSKATYHQPIIVSEPTPEVYETSLHCPSGTEGIVSSSPQQYFNPSVVASDSIGVADVSGVAYPSVVEEIPLPVPQLHFSSPEVISNPSNGIGTPGFALPQTLAAPAFAYPETSRSNLVQSSYPSAGFSTGRNHYSISLPGDLSRTQSLSNVPRVISASDLTKYFPSIKSQIQKSAESVELGSTFDGTKWTITSPQRDPFHDSYENGHRWTVSPSQKPNEFSVTEYFPVRIPYFDQGIKGDVSSALFHHEIPDFDHGVSEEVIVETATFPSVRSASKTDSSPSERHQHRDQSKTPRQKSTHRHRKDPLKATPLDVYATEHDLGPVSNAEHPLEPVFVKENLDTAPIPSIQHETLPIHNLEAPPVNTFDSPVQFNGQYEKFPAHNFEATPTTIHNNPAQLGGYQTFSHNLGQSTAFVSVPVAPEIQHPTFSVGAVPTGAQSQIYPPLGSVPVSIQRVEPSKFIVKHEEPYVINYQSSPYILDVMRNPM